MVLLWKGWLPVKIDESFLLFSCGNQSNLHCYLYLWLADAVSTSIRCSWCCCYCSPWHIKFGTPSLLFCTHWMFEASRAKKLIMDYYGTSDACWLANLMLCLVSLSSIVVCRYFLLFFLSDFNFVRKFSLNSQHDMDVISRKSLGGRWLSPQRGSFSTPPSVPIYMLYRYV